MMAMSRQITPPAENQYMGSYTEDAGGDGLRMNAYNHEDVDVSFDPLSANRRFPSTDDLAVLGTLIFAGPTRESIDVMVPDCLLPSVGGEVRVDLCHHVSLSLGPAVDMGNWVPEPNLEQALCPTSLAKTPTPRVLGGTEPYSSEMEKRQRHSLSGVRASDTGEHGPSSPADSYYVRLLLAVPGDQLFAMVYVGTECQGPY